ncbi:TetR/AcrR family transcriptional regulator [Kribbella koreensis]|uniref:TetR/AcrR family transcriptional regulator n=1 Tax=Kribbella koreensis TaxID=57909 RepID=A0ABP4BBU9_9ACTN
MTTFQRARSEEQRAVRRQAILTTAAAMLAEMPVAQLSLNELSRRVGLAKSNVLNYFDSREAVLLELLDAETHAWMDQLDAELTATVDPAAAIDDRAAALADAIVTTLESRPMLCALTAAQAAVLEHNISVEVAADFKRGSIANYAVMIRHVLAHLPELGEDGAGRLIAATVMLTGVIWTHSHPSAAIIAVYETDPEVAAFRITFAPTLREALQTILVGVLPR